MILSPSTEYLHNVTQDGSVMTSGLQDGLPSHNQSPELLLMMKNTARQSVPHVINFIFLDLSSLE